MRTRTCLSHQSEKNRSRGLVAGLRLNRGKWILLQQVHTHKSALSNYNASSDLAVHLIQPRPDLLLLLMKINHNTCYQSEEQQQDHGYNNQVFSEEHHVYCKSGNGKAPFQICRG